MTVKKMKLTEGGRGEDIKYLRRSNRAAGIRLRGAIQVKAACPRCYTDRLMDKREGRVL